MNGIKRTPIWLDCDTGHDDAFAILLAAHSPQVELLGISTTYGNARLSKTTYNTRAILRAIGREDVPVYAGAARPYCREPAHAPDIHGESGLDGTTCLPVPQVSARSDKTAVEAMYAALIATPRGSAWVVPTGAFTNVALLFAVHPDLVDHVAGVSAMGGAVGGGFTDAPMGTVAGKGVRFGNITPFAEFNIYIDPESARSLLSNKGLAGKTTLVTLDLTHRFLATKQVQETMLRGKSVQSKEPSVVRKLFVEILMFFAKTYADVFGITAGPPVHDVLAVVAAFAPHVLQDDQERYGVEVVIDGAHGLSIGETDSQCGRTVVTPVPSGGFEVRIPKALDAETVWNMLDECLKRAERATG